MNECGGLTAANIQDIRPEYRCGLCELLLLEPTQLGCCGTRLCRWCSKVGLTDSEPFVCRFCESIQPKIEIYGDKAIERDLNRITIQCYACPWTGLYQEYKGHLQNDHADIQCSECYQKFYSRNLFEEHRQEICEHCLVACGVPGCDEKIRRNRLAEHLLETDHQLLLLASIKTLSNRKSTRNYALDQLIREKVMLLSQNVEMGLSKANDSFEELAAIKLKFNQIEQMLSKFWADINDGQSHLNEIEKSIKSIELTQKDIRRDLSVIENGPICDPNFLLDSESTVILKFSKPVQEMNSQFSMCSPIIKTSPYGYNFILRLCSTSQDENPKTTYLSLYIALVHGDYDAILTFPFAYNISLCLCDQSQENKHIMSIIKADPNSAAFARPTTDRNEEIGIIKFCSLHYLFDTNSTYLKDDFFFIKISMDFF